MLVRPISQTSVAFQWNGQLYHEWPKFVQNSCTLKRETDRLNLLHTRKSGVQWVYLTEWLIKDMDNLEARWFTDKQFLITFELAS